MTSLKDKSLGEIAAYVAEHLHKNSINVVLTGGSCVSIYTENRYQSFDLDFIEETSSGRKRIAAILAQLGFQEKNRYFVHPDTPYFIEFPSGPLAIGDEPISEVAQLEFSTGSLRLLSPTDCIKDRLANFYHWKDRQCLEQAIMVAAETEVDMEEIERWSQHEGMTEEFGRIKVLLRSKQ